MTDLMLPYDLQQKMLAKSAEIDQAIEEYRTRHVEWVNTSHTADIAVNTALTTATGANAQERKARADLGAEQLIWKAKMAKALMDSALEALRARREQLNALNALAYTIRTEMQLAR